LSEEKIKAALVFLTAVFAIVFCLGPFIYMTVVSLSSEPDFLSGQGSFAASLDNYRIILTVESLHFLDFLRNSMVISLVTAFVTVFIAGLAAYAVTRIPLRGKSIILIVVVAISMFPQISLVSYLFRLMTSLGWLNTYQGLILPYIAWALPLSVWILASYFSQIPVDLDNAARVDGCTRWQALHKIILPVAAPGLFSTLILVFIFCFNEFLFALMLTSDHQARTIPVGIALFQGMHGEIPWGTIMAASIVTTMPIVIITIIFQRRIITGLTHGAIKG